FAVQWGIQVIEPDRLPFLLLHNLCGRFVPAVRGIELHDPDNLWDEVPNLITPLQNRLERMGRIVREGEERVISEYRMNWAIDHAQRVIGDHYWDAMDEHNPLWLEERFDRVSALCRLETGSTLRVQ